MAKKLDWRKIAGLALFGIVAFTASIGFAFWQWPDDYAPLSYQAEQQNAGNRETYAACDPTYVATLPATADRLEKAYSCANDAQERQAGREDLIEQRRAADAAEANALLGVRQARIAAIQTGFTGLAFFAAALAVFYAQRAARHTERQVRIAKKTAYRQMRAYLTVEGGQAGFDKDGVLTVSPALKNVGQTPAHNVRFFADAALLTVKEADHRSFEVAKHEGLSLMTIGGSEPQLMRIPLQRDRATPAQVADCLTNSPLKLFVFGQVYYNDVFGKPHVTKFCRFVEWGPINKDGQPDGHVLWGWKTHNEAT